MSTLTACVIHERFGLGSMAAENEALAYNDDRRLAQWAIFSA
jgi:hypothetical protein